MNRLNLAGVDLARIRSTQEAMEAAGDVLPVADLALRVLPPGVRLVYGAADVTKYITGNGLSVIVTAARELDGRRWLHVSFARRSRLPTWEDMRFVKDVFIGRDRKAISVLPPESEHVNIHPYCLHIWCCLDGDGLPDFTHGSGSL